MSMNYPQIATGVYQQCAAYDQYLPELVEPVARAWAKVFERYQLTAEDLTAAVDKLYAENGSGWKPLPADIALTARTIRQERAQREAVTEVRPALTSAERDRAARARVDAILALARAKQLDDGAAADGSAGSNPLVGPNPLKVSCDHCGVPAGTHCVVAGTNQRLTKTAYHDSRVQKAKAAVGAA